MISRIGWAGLPTATVVDSALISLIEHSCNFAKEHGWTHCIYGLCVWGESENGSTANER
ncbi:hypothetical protein BLIJ_0586 [Bifidobacterium longum subsp. infantis ATCC 15697 = JCM 1222 = DSM 20088]|nr:hypothetical protein BLIJ_0586 [Bifidobacterium longum subsp. infantis ATCC 15697 = JCM 1222 = DSM 20088]